MKAAQVQEPRGDRERMPAIEVVMQVTKRRSMLRLVAEVLEEVRPTRHGGSLLREFCKAVFQVLAVGGRSRVHREVRQ